MSARPEPDPRRARVRMGAGAALILLLAGLAIAVLITAIAPHGSSSLVAAAGSPPAGSPQAGSPQAGGTSTAASTDDGVAAAGDDTGLAPVFVHILGQVTHPGLYELSQGDRVIDAVAAAGGFTDTASPAGINLARLLSDGEQLVVPAAGEALPSAAGGAAGSTVGAKINLNTADVTALDTLPRIGPAMAQRIVDWRTANGRFSSIDDLLAVTGIGQKTLDGLRDLVTT